MKLVTVDRSLKDKKSRSCCCNCCCNCTLHVGCNFYRFQTPINYQTARMNKVYFVMVSDAFGYV